MVLVTSTSTIKACKKTYTPSATENNISLLLNTLPLKHVLCIHYLVCFKKDQTKVQALLDSGNNVNTITLAYTARFGFKVRPTDIRAEKIDGSIF